MPDTFDANWDKLHKAASEIQNVDELVEFLNLLSDIVRKSEEHRGRFAIDYIEGMSGWLDDRSDPEELEFVEEPSWPLIASLALKGVYYN